MRSLGIWARLAPCVEAQGQAGGPQDVVGARPPCRLEETVHHPDHLVDRQVDVTAAKHVERRRLRVLGVDDDRALLSPVGQPVEDVLNQRAFWVDDHGAASRAHVVEHHVEEQRRLSRAGRPHHVHVVGGITRSQCNRTSRPGVGVAEDPPLAADFRRRRDALGAGAGEPRHVSVEWQVRECSKLGHRVQVAPARSPGTDGCCRSRKAPRNEVVLCRI